MHQKLDLARHFKHAEPANIQYNAKSVNRQWLIFYFVQATNRDIRKA